MPTTTILPPNRTDSSAEPSARTDPELSIQRSGAWSPKLCLKCSSRGFSLRFAVRSPARSAAGRRASESCPTPVRSTSAPLEAASIPQRTPIGPGPDTTTFSPGFTSARTATACTATASGSHKAATVRSRPSGTGTRHSSDARAYSAIPPSRESPTATRLGHNCVEPERQVAHLPQPCIAITTTRSPGLTSRTPSLTASTVPENSWPSVTGARTHSNPGSDLNACRSLPHTPQEATRSKTSPGPGSTTGTSTTPAFPGSEPVLTKAFIHLPPEFCGQAGCGQN